MSGRIFKKKEYLSDGVYIGYGEHYLELWTSDGENITNRIFIEEDTLQFLLRSLGANLNRAHLKRAIGED
jgi:hypothetical protein